MLEVHVTQTPPPEGFPWHDVLPLVPSVLWIIVIIGFVWYIGPDRIMTLLSRATKIGIAVRPDELFHLILDALERRGR